MSVSTVRKAGCIQLQHSGPKLALL
uniref:Uncharacterized protein n=1 Tax=Anguilla anguilla TaxID=7936 RepID=A0A0E9Q1J5_ANGAN